MAHFDIPSRLFMSSPVHTISPDADLQSVRDALELHRVSSLAVVDGDASLVGVISRTDILRVARREAGNLQKAANLTLPNKSVSEVMGKDLATVDVEDPVRESAALMVKKGFHRVYVTQDGALAGVLSTRDLMVAIRDKRVNMPISEFMSSPIFTIRSTEPISMATERLEKARISGLIVMEGDWPVGLFTQVDALGAQNRARDTKTEDVMNTAFVCMPVDTPIHRAAAQATALRARRVIAVSKRESVGILTGIDFARCAAN